MKKAFWSRLIALGMTAVLLVSLVGCGGGKTPDANERQTTIPAIPARPTIPWWISVATSLF